MTKVYYDMLGNIIRPGDLVVAPASKGRSAELRMGIVAEMYESSKGYCKVIRLSSGYYKKGKVQFKSRKHSYYCERLVVVRWDSVKEDSKFCEPLNKAKKKVMTGK